MSGETVLSLLRGIERARRRLDSVDHAVIAQAETVGLPFENGCKNTVVFLRPLLSIHPGEAAGRVKAAHRFGPRRMVTGIAVEPEYPKVAAALADGSISFRHATLIADTITKLPDGVAVGLDEVEQTLVANAKQFDPEVLATIAERTVAYLDPDGKLADHTHREHNRSATITRRSDGSGRIEIDATAELAELMHTVFGPLAAPAPAEDGTPDVRTPAQRRHDALTDALKRAISAGLPDAGGMRTTVILTMDVTDFANNSGMATTGSGYPIPVKIAKTWLEPEARSILCCPKPKESKRIHRCSGCSPNNNA